MATPPSPPAAQIEIKQNLLFDLRNSLAALVTIRPPVAANGCPIAMDLENSFLKKKGFKTLIFYPPFTFTFERSIFPSAFSLPQNFWQN